MQRLPDFKYEKKVWKKGLSVVAGVDEVGRGCFAGPVVAGCVIFESFSGVLPLINSGPVSRQPQIHPQGGNPGFGAPRRSPPIINDSKKLTQKQRDVADAWIRKNAAAFGIGQATVSQINRLGIKKATEVAFRKAILLTNKKLEDRNQKSDDEIGKSKIEVGLQTSNLKHRIQSSDPGRQSSKIEYLFIDAFYIPYVKGLRQNKQKPIIHGDSKSISIAAASIVAKVYRDKLMTRLSKQTKYKKYQWHKNKGYGTKEHRRIILKHGTTRLHRKRFVETWLKNSKLKPQKLNLKLSNLKLN